MSQPISNAENPLGTERIARLLPRYAIPSIVSLLIGSLYNIVDQIFIGRGVGYLGNCATSILFPLTVIGLAFALLIGDGAAAHLSLCQGRNNTEGFDRCLGNGLLVGAAISVVYMAVFNIIFDPVLIFGFDMGVTGAAIATIGGQILSTAVAVDYLRKSKTFRLRKGSFRLCPSALKAALPLGISSFLTQFAIVLTSGVSNALLVVYGADSVFGPDIPIAVMGIVMKVFAICVSIAIGLAVGAQPIVGYNYSAGNYRRVQAAFNLVTELTVAVCAVASRSSPSSSPSAVICCSNSP